jgi:hypothetical protein
MEFQQIKNTSLIYVYYVPAATACFASAFLMRQHLQHMCLVRNLSDELQAFHSWQAAMTE